MLKRLSHIAIDILSASFDNYKFLKISTILTKEKIHFEIDECKKDLKTKYKDICSFSPKLTKDILNGLLKYQ